ncbi:hypothetical protein AB0929_28390 [Streptomyces massasporeus]|uniref:hypothetical protein n=1 Tax=Streptomyces massasporeus TaxID=67324 RepID=UPI003452FD3C
MNLRPADLPELRAELVRHMASHRGRHQLGRFDGTKLTTGASLVGTIRSGDLQTEEVRRLSHAELFYVSPEMTDLTIAASDSLPFFALNREDLPSEHGLMVFAKPVVLYPNEDGRPEAQIRACCWMVADHGAVWLSFYSDWHAWLEESRTAGAFQPETVDESLQNDHWLCFETFVCGPLAKRRDIEGEWEEEAQEVGTLDNAVRAAWLLMQQPLARIEDLEPDRATRKRLRRLGHEPAPVRLIGLRRPRATAGQGEGSREYQHQWIVRGHWRQQWYPKRQVHRPVWIAPHIKGPEGAPVIGGEKVNVWKR